MQYRVTGTMVSYYFVCKRKLYYHAHQLRMEQNNEDVALGKLLDESSYTRDEKHITIDDTISIDFIREHCMLHEIKKSKAIEESGIWQLKYYLYYLKQRGCKEMKGKIGYPLLHRSVEVELTEADEYRLKEVIKEIQEICDGAITEEFPKKKSICKKCAYFDLCFI